MAPVSLILALVAMANVAYAADPSDPTTDPDYPKFLEFAEKFKRQYSSAAEAHGRFLNFKANLAKIVERNARGQEQHGVTKFADWSLEEFRKWSLGYRKNHTTTFAQVKEFPLRDKNVRTASIDWRQKGALTPVKNQGQCGSCWAFSATEQIESDYFLKYNDLKVLSPQQITSCDTVDLGCNGGDTVTAYQYVANTAKGQEWNKDYPYTSGTTGETGTCKFKAADRTADLSAAYYVSQNAGQESNMLQQVEQSPMSICVDAETWQTYESGIVTTKSGCGTQLDHCVQVAGYNAEQNYWIVRNSWATDWGNQGYIWVEAGHNVCGIAQEATIVTGSNPPSQDDTITV